LSFFTLASSSNPQYIKHIHKSQPTPWQCYRIQTTWLSGDSNPWASVPKAETLATTPLRQCGYGTYVFSDSESWIHL
jgi:hypothetical protein